ncbi:MAG: pyridoxal-phosphate dependent enzyme, partial [Actinobacteria bacterium]|nr:pyridoxal-phosphate dependent enzyme [Actinomycetota bacterium]
MDSILEAIGQTPLVRLRRCAPPNGAELWLKLEYRSPTGSMKDRMALAMIEGAERDGLLSPGETVVEYTGGSTGPALALVCRAKGYRALIVMADCFTEERFQLIRALGAEIDVVASVEGRPKVTVQDIHNMVARAEELAKEPGPTRPTGSTTISGGSRGPFLSQGWTGFFFTAPFSDDPLSRA